MLSACNNIDSPRRRSLAETTVETYLFCTVLLLYKGAIPEDPKIVTRCVN